MSSGFVSGGTADAPIERDEAWLAAQQEVEAKHRRKAELTRQNEGKSLFETLEANKGNELIILCVFVTSNPSLITQGFLNDSCKARSI
jgi:hypothetical protein